MPVAEIMPGVPVKQWPELYCRIPRAELNVPWPWKSLVSRVKAEGGSDAKFQFLGPELRTPRALKRDTSNDQIPNM